jgi:hypothetical protein
MEEHDARHSALSRVLRADALKVRLPIAPLEVHPDDLDRPRFGLHHALFVDEKRDAVLRESRRDGRDGFVIVVAVAREHLPGHLTQRLERAP